MHHHRQVVFQHVVQKSEAYQIGRDQARIVGRIPGFADFLQSGAGKFAGRQFKTATKLMTQFCPGLVEEIRGLADGLEIPPQAIIFYLHSYLRKGNCSHFAVLPALTVDNRLLVGRSYEFGDTLDDLRLCTMQVNGKYGFIGFSTLLFGFNEGMNEHGLVVTNSAGGIPVGVSDGLRPPIQDGLQFWIAVRAILENCRSVDEALDLVGRFPFAGNPNLIVADLSGAAALIEIHGPQMAIRKIDKHSSRQFLCSTNHYTLPEMGPQNKAGVMANSRLRYRTIQTYLDQNGPHDTRSLQTLLAAEYPAGLCCHYYDEFFGTLRSMVFDPGRAEISVCFGPPTVNAWHRIDFNTPMKSYPVRLPIASAAPEFWQAES